MKGKVSSQEMKMSRGLKRKSGFCYFSYFRFSVVASLAKSFTDFLRALTSCRKASGHLLRLSVPTSKEPLLIWVQVMESVWSSSLG